MAPQASSSITVLFAVLYLHTVLCNSTVSASTTGFTKSGLKHDGYIDCNKTAYSLEHPWRTSIFISTVYSIVLLIGLPANGLSIWILAIKIKKVPSTLFLLNLATADLFFLLVLPFKFPYYFKTNWIFGEFFSWMSLAICYVNMYCSILFLTCISVDRYFSLVHPFTARSSRSWGKSLFISISIWVVVAAASIPFLIGKQTSKFTNVDNTTCHNVPTICHKKNWLMYHKMGLVISGFVIPFLVMVFCNVSILLTLTPKRRNYCRLLWLISLVLITFLLCFTPSNVLLFYLSLTHDLKNCIEVYQWYNIALAVSALNSCIDPFIYYFTSSNFRILVKTSLYCQRENNKALSNKTSDQLLQQQKFAEQP